MNGHLKVAVIEDSRTDAMILKQVVREGLEAEVTTCYDGLEGLRTVLATPPDIILLDLHLPGLGGEEVCRMVRSSPRHSWIPVIVVSGIADSKRRELETLGIGANAYLSKPFDPKLLLATMRGLLGLDGADSGQADARLLDTEANVQVRSATSTVEATAANPAVRRAEEARRHLGTMFGGYLLEEVIGSGGFGNVYRAVQRSLDRTVAIKVLLSDAGRDQEVRMRFRREARIMARLNHPNIVQVFDMGEREHTIYIAMEYVDGPSLQSVLGGTEAETLPPERQVEVIDQLCRALTYLHGEGVIHRDIKPTNVLLGSNGTVKLTDFGISRPPRTKEDLAITHYGQVIGTPYFMAPEVAAGQPADPRSDIFSLGLTLWTMVTGSRRGIPGVVPACERSRLVPAKLSRAIEKCYAQEPGARYQSAEEARRGLLGAIALGY